MSELDVASLPNQADNIAAAWINFDGNTGVTAIRQSYNISSLIEDAVGNFTANLENQLLNWYVVNTNAGSTTSTTAQCYSYAWDFQISYFRLISRNATNFTNRSNWTVQVYSYE